MQESLKIRVISTQISGKSWVIEAKTQPNIRLQIKIMETSVGLFPASKIGVGLVLAN